MIAFAFKRFWYVPSVLFSLLYTLGEKIFNLTVDGTKIVLCPGGKILVQLRVKSQRHLLLVILFH